MTCVPWESIPAISSTLLLQKIRAFIAAEVFKGNVLTTVEQLRASFNLTANTYLHHHSLLIYLGRLQRLGILRRFSFGNLLLLKPELLDSYAAAIIFSAMQEPDGMGSVMISSIRPGNVSIPERDRLLPREQERLLLAATIEDLLSHEIALRESSSNGELLIFPSQLTRENPSLPDPEGKDLRIVFSGPVLNIYASLVVRLAHSDVFSLDEMWRNAAAFGTDVGGKCGIVLLEKGDGEGNLILFYGEHTSNVIKQQFEHYVLTHLLRRANANSVRSERYFACLDKGCRTPISDIAVQRRRARGFTFIECNVCGSTLSISDSLSGPVVVEPTSESRQIDLTADLGKKRETALISASGEMLTNKFIDWAGSERTTLALVFTDIVGSTSLASERGDEEMFEIRLMHFAQARAILHECGGYEIKTIGDSFMIAFKSVLEGLRFCLKFIAEPGHEALEIRAGIHVGPIRIDENDAFGAMVNFASRVISSISDSGIRMSDRAYQDLAAEKPKAFRKLVWKKLESIEVKGFPGTHTFWELEQKGE